MESFGRSFGRSFKKRLGLPHSPSPSPERGKKIRKRAESPPPLTQQQIADQIQQAQAQSLAIRREEMARQEQDELLRQLKEQSDEDVNYIIDSINDYLSVVEINVDIEDPFIRFIVIMIVNSNKARKNAKQTIYEKLARSKLLLTAIANVIIKVARKSGTHILNIVQILLPIIQQSGTAAYDFASRTASTFGNYLTGRQIEQIEPVERRAAASPPRQSSYSDMASSAYNYAATGLATGLPIFYSALSSVLIRVYSLLLQCGSAGASIVVSAARYGFKRASNCLQPENAVEQAVNQVAPQQKECAICLGGSEYGVLGYIIRHGSDKIGHPDSFHLSCLQSCPGNKCPMCRADSPAWSTNPLPGQGGGISKKYSRSRSRSKSKSKSRRYISKPHKSRKARKRVRHASSRRK